MGSELGGRDDNGIYEGGSSESFHAPVSRMIDQRGSRVERVDSVFSAWGLYKVGMITTTVMTLDVCVILIAILLLRRAGLAWAGPVLSAGAIVLVLGFALLPLIWARMSA